MAVELTQLSPQTGFEVPCHTIVEDVCQIFESKGSVDGNKTDILSYPFGELELGSYEKRISLIHEEIFWQKP